MKTFRIISAATAVLVLSGCNILKDGKVDPKALSNLTVNCTASLPDGTNGVVDPDTAISIALHAQGGVSPYQIVGVDGNFDSDTTVSHTYANTTADSLVKDDTIAVKDSLGLTANCPLTVTVKPHVTPASDLACVIEVSSSTPRIGDVTFFYLKASGGSSPYEFHDLRFGADSSSVIGLSKLVDGRSGGAAYYNSAGPKSASATLTDSKGTLVSCSKNLNVRGTPGVSLTASPSTNVASNSSVTLTASATGFADTPSYSFSTTETGIVFSGTGNATTVTSSSSTASHSFDVKVTVTDSLGESATATKHLVFTPAVTTSPLACTATVSPNPVRYGYVAIATASIPSNSGVGAVRIVNVYSGPPANLAYIGNSTDLNAGIVFYGIGTFPVWVQVQDSTGATSTCVTQENTYY